MVLAGRYRLVRRIAAGGMGTVHEGLDERLGRRVAVKVLREEYADDPGFVARFEREARAAAGLSHPNIAQVLDTGRDGDRHFIVMELVDGGHLGQLLRDEGPLCPEKAAGIAVQVCRALGAAHAAGVVHRDVKPGNVLVDRAGRVQVTDFGIAHTGGQTSLTRTGSVLGTVAYLSPEQAAGQRATPASDLYAVGVVLFEMLTGSVPFAGDSAVAVALRHLQEEVPDVRDRAPDVPPALAGVVARATAKDPQDRFADAEQMEQALRSALARPDVTTTAVLPAVAPPGTSPGRGRGRWAAVAAAVVVAAAGLGWFASQGGPDPTTAPAPAPEPAQQVGPTPTLRSPSPTTPPQSPEPTVTGPVVPTDALGRDVEELEERLKEA
ncbi:MAG TPA: protein kinase, partial [Nocardioidaceae bacterium]